MLLKAEADVVKSRNDFQYKPNLLSINKEKIII